jgi:hypothetical protein
MSTQDESGPAFPEKPIGMDCTTAGLTKREYFALHFATAIIAHPGEQPDDNHRDGVADLAIEFADALLKRLGAT